ncbi:MAG: hypothetical protein HYZ37_15730, partial [Candidatus Solibacter usitatus]|nr:hypothetical protein [Candidatus Solibacter usitatus]
MKTKTFLLLFALLVPALFLRAQKQSDIVTGIMGGEKPVIAIPVFRGSGEAQKQMDTFNRTLNDEISGAGIFSVVALSMMPLRNPQVPQDIRESMRGTGYALSDWSATPVSANFLAFGYTGIQNN